MRTHICLGAAGTIALFLAAGCDRAAREEAQAQQAQQSAAQNSVAYHAQADQKAATDQAQANEETRQANLSLSEEAGNFRVSAQKDLDDVAKKVDDLKAKSIKAPAPQRQQFAAAIANVDSKRATVENHLRSLQPASAQDLDQAKQQVNSEIAQLKQSVDDAAKTI